MQYDARQIANWFVSRAQKDGKTLSIMSLLKLTYIAHGWHLEMRQTPLFENEIQAWKYGPVVPEVYNSFRAQGVAVNKPIQEFSVVIDPDNENLLDQIWTIYGNMSSFQLSDITHEAGGPWHIASQMGGNYAKIPDDLIRKHYEMKRMNFSKAANG